MLSKVLTCTPTYFTVDYQINPWMKPGSVDTKKAMTQWENLIKVYQETGIEVETIEQDKSQPDMPFSADQGLVINPSNDKPTINLSNFKHKERQGETKFYKKWFEKNGYKVEALPKEIKFEGGGELLPWKGKFFIGQGFRNSSKASKYIHEKFGVEFIPLTLINEKYYHLDTCMFILNPNTIFYYPEAFDGKSIEIIKKSFENIVEFSENEVESFAANSVVSGRNVFMQTGSKKFKETVESFGYTAFEVDISEFMKSGGGIHCLTFELQRLPHLEVMERVRVKEVRGGEG